MALEAPHTISTIVRTRFKQPAAEGCRKEWPAVERRRTGGVDTVRGRAVNDAQGAGGMTLVVNWAEGLERE